MNNIFSLWQVTKMQIASALNVSSLLVFCSACPDGDPGWINLGDSSCYHEAVVSMSWFDSVDVSCQQGYIKLRLLSSWFLDNSNHVRQNNSKQTWGRCPPPPSFSPIFRACPVFKNTKFCIGIGIKYYIIKTDIGLAISFKFVGILEKFAGKKVQNWGV